MNANEAQGPAGLKAITVLGANGFVGDALCRIATQQGYAVRGVSRTDWNAPDDVEKLIAPNPDAEPELFAGGGWAVNCIGRAHMIAEGGSDEALERFRTVNRDLAISLAQKARDADIKRFVHISSVAAVRSTSIPHEVIDDDVPNDPDRPYGISKLEADRILLEGDPSAMSIACLRPPALIGPRPTGFVRKFAKAASRGLPLPIGGIENARSFMAVQNLAEAIIASLKHGLHGSYIVTDSTPVSVGELYCMMLQSAGYNNRSVRLPRRLTEIAAGVALGERKDSLLGNAAYNGARFAQATGWRPSLPLQGAIDEMMAAL